MFKHVAVNHNVEAVDEFGVWTCAWAAKASCPEQFDRTITDHLEVREKMNQNLLEKNIATTNLHLR